MTLASARKGATTDDWQRFIDLGLLPDLLPVVADIDTPIAPDSKLVPGQLGKIPSRLNNDGFAVGIPGWTTTITNSQKVARWRNQPVHGICVVCRQVKVIDIDIEDRQAAGRVLDVITALLGDAPRRTRANSGKLALMVRCGAAVPKRVIQTAHGIIELLGERQQFVAVSTHKSGARYEWTGPLSAEGLPTEVPEVTLAELDLVWEALVSAFAIPGGSHVLHEGSGAVVPRRADDREPDPVADFLVEKGLVRGEGSHGELFVECPWHDQHSTGSENLTGTVWFPAGVGGLACGGFDCRHTSHGKKTTSEFLAAVGYDVVGEIGADFPVVEREKVMLPSGELAEPPEDPQFVDRDKRTRKWEAHALNLELALRAPHFTGAKLAVDVFLDDQMWCECNAIGEPVGVWRSLKQEDYQELRIRLQRRGFKPVGMKELQQAVQHVAADQAFDSAQEWLAALPAWDGQDRLRPLMHRVFGAEDTPYAAAVGEYLFTALAGRVLQPGCQADMVPILIGLQGAQKTKTVRAIAPTVEAFVEVDLGQIDNVDMARKLSGKLIGELGEMKGMREKEVEAVKTWATRTHEDFRDLYANKATKRARRVVFVGTGNDEELLRDSTGNRRWLPLHVGRVNLDWVIANRDQLWAQGAAMFRESGVAWREAEALARAEHSKFTVSDPWTILVEDWIERRGAMDEFENPCKFEDGVVLPEIMMSALRIPADRMSERDQKRVGGILRTLGWEKRRTRVRGGLKMLWFPAENLGSEYC